MKNRYNNSLKLINQISRIRSKNNKNWMDILKIAFKNDPKNASKVLSNITNFEVSLDSI